MKPNQKQLPPLTDFRVRRLKARLPLDVLGVKAGVPMSSLSRFERGEADLRPDQRERLEEALRAEER